MNSKRLSFSRSRSYSELSDNLNQTRVKNLSGGDLEESMESLDKALAPKNQTVMANRQKTPIFKNGPPEGYLSQQRLNVPSAYIRKTSSGSVNNLTFHAPEIAHKMTPIFSNLGPPPTPRLVAEPIQGSSGTNSYYDLNQVFCELILG